jgi:hypothetical protein
LWELFAQQSGEDSIITMYCCYDDFLNIQRNRHDQQCRVSTAQVLVVLLVVRLVHGNLVLAHRFLVSHGYLKHNLSALYCYRHLHSTAQEWRRILFRSFCTVFTHAYYREMDNKGQRTQNNHSVFDSMQDVSYDDTRLRHGVLSVVSEFRGKRLSLTRALSTR